MGPFALTHACGCGCGGCRWREGSGRLAPAATLPTEGDEEADGDEQQAAEDADEGEGSVDEAEQGALAAPVLGVLLHGRVAVADRAPGREDLGEAVGSEGLLDLL